MKDRKGLGQSRRWVVKVGSALVTDNGRGLDESALAGWATQIAALHGQGAPLGDPLGRGSARAAGPSARPAAAWAAERCRNSRRDGMTADAERIVSTFVESA